MLFVIDFYRLFSTFNRVTKVVKIILVFFNKTRQKNDFLSKNTKKPSKRGLFCVFGVKNYTSVATDSNTI